MDQLPRLGKRELICLLLFTCNYVVSVWRGFLFLWVLGMGYVILLWHFLSLPLIISFSFSANIADMRILFQIICNCYTKVFDSIHLLRYRKPEFYSNVFLSAASCCI